MQRSAIRSALVFSLLTAIVLLFLTFPADAIDVHNDFDGYTKYLWYHAHYDVNLDGTHTATRGWALKVLAEQGVERAQQASVTYSDRLQKVEVLSAYTLKADGRKVNVPATNFQDETNTGKGDASPMFSDLRTLTVAFPDVAVGDTVVWNYKETQKEGTFPGNFSLLQTFSKFEVYDDVQVSVSAPSALSLYVFSRGVDGGEAPTTDGRSNWAWSYKNLKMATPEDSAVSSMDYGPIIVVSTFKDYAALAEAYNARAKTKFALTDRIKKLADDLTKGLKTPREQAAALYNWVAQNIKYAGSCVGVGAVVPHDADLVLANRMGDCKDHTTLLQALLAAKGIVSVPTLINSGNSYKLPPVPCIETFNHVISYIPSLDVYADSTSEYTPFGALPVQDYGKPVVQTIDFKSIQNTRELKWNEDGQSSRTVLKINADGSGEGETVIESKGPFADGIRYSMRYLQPNLEDSVVRRALGGQGFSGTGTLDKGDLRIAGDTYTYSSKYKISDAINLPGPGALSIKSPFDGDGEVARYVTEASAPDATVDFTCSGGFAKTSVTIVLPKDVKVLALPKDVEIKGEYQTYKATYSQKDGTITAVREIADRTPGPTCAPAVHAEYKKFGIAVGKNLKAQLLYE